MSLSLQWDGASICLSLGGWWEPLVFAVVPDPLFSSMVLKPLSSSMVLDSLFPSMVLKPLSSSMVLDPLPSSVVPDPFPPLWTRSWVVRRLCFAAQLLPGCRCLCHQGEDRDGIQHLQGSARASLRGSPHGGGQGGQDAIVTLERGEAAACRAEHPCEWPAHPAAAAGEPCAVLPVRLSHRVARLLRRAWAHGRDSAPRLPALATGPAAPGAPVGESELALCRAPGDPVAEEGLAFLSQRGEEEEGGPGCVWGTTHKEGVKEHLLVRVGARICPTRVDRAALKCKAKETGFALPLCAYGTGSQVGKSSQMAQAWPAGPTGGTGTRPECGEGDGSPCLAACICTPCQPGHVARTAPAGETEQASPGSVFGKYQVLLDRLMFKLTVLSQCTRSRASTWGCVPAPSLLPCSQARRSPPELHEGLGLLGKVQRSLCSSFPPSASQSSPKKAQRELGCGPQSSGD